MVDQQTESLWAHLLGEAMRGPLQGAVLKSIPSVMTDWKTWRTHHPETTVVVMPRTAGQYRRSFHMQDSGIVIGLAEKERSRHWSFAFLYDKPVINDHFATQPVVVVFHRPSFTAVIYDRRVQGKTLTFERKAGQLMDRETGTVWNLLTGVAISGKLKGKKLKRLNGIVSDAAVWATFHPLNDTQWRPETISQSSAVPMKKSK
ncbi:MAG: hypothetical protein Tsb009_32460 [Planctomycetaceae bacterium]